jgi:hypothetical protein
MNKRQNYQLLGWYRDSSGVPQSMSCGLYRFLHRHSPKVATEQEKADFVVQCRQIIKTARVLSVESGGDRDQLKPVADEARRLIHEIPEHIPNEGFPNIDRLEYDSWLSSDEIEEKLLGELKRRQLLEWFEFSAGGKECL